MVGCQLAYLAEWDWCVIQEPISISLQLAAPLDKTPDTPSSLGTLRIIPSKWPAARALKTAPGNETKQRQGQGFWGSEAATKKNNEN